MSDSLIIQQLNGLNERLEKQEKLSEKQYKHIGDAIKLSTANTNKIDNLIDNIQPILDGVHSIQESVKVLDVIKKIIVWVSTIIVAVSSIAYTALF